VYVGEATGVDKDRISGVGEGINIGAAAGVGRGEIGDENVGVESGVAVGVGGTVESGVETGVIAEAGVEIRVDVTKSKRAIVVATGEVSNAGQSVGSVVQPSSLHESRTRYTPNVASPASEPLSTYTYNVTRRISVPGGNT
jgi:hypothetical protein